MSQVLVVGAACQQRSRLIDQGLLDASAEVAKKSWPAFLRTKRSAARTLVIYDLAAESAPDMEILLKLAFGGEECGVLYLADANLQGLESLTKVLQNPNVDFMLGDDVDPRELRLRAMRLIARVSNGESVSNNFKSDALTPPLLQNAFRHTVPYLHSSNGRLDAREISLLYGITLGAVARTLGRSEQTVHRTPDANRLQSGLYVFERIAACLLHLTGSKIGLRTWMQASNPQLDHQPPINVLLCGKGEIVAELLDAVLRGETG